MIRPAFGNIARIFAVLVIDDRWRILADLFAWERIVDDLDIRLEQRRFIVEIRVRIFKSCVLSWVCSDFQIIVEIELAFGEERILGTFIGGTLGNGRRFPSWLPLIFGKNLESIYI